MITRITMILKTLAIVPLIVALSGCVYADTSRISRFEVHQDLPGRVLDGPSVAELLEVCDALARDLAHASVIEDAQVPVVLEVDPSLLHDRTNQNVDTAIYAEVIREALIGSMDGKIAFRDRHVYADAIRDKRAAQFTGNTAGRDKAEARLKRLAAVDYHLVGFIYRQDDVTPRWTFSGGHGFRYYRIQFRLVDPHTGLIPWEKHYHFKNVGRQLVRIAS